MRMTASKHSLSFSLSEFYLQARVLLYFLILRLIRVSNACLQLKNCEKNCATDGGGRSNKIDILLPAELPERDGWQFVLHSLPVRDK
jgi:hypothetical protein